jgi:carbonic anhydrase/acetyltransferase-like protein (isoleucine patch superfamily)
VVHNNVHVGQGVTLRGCVIGKSTDVIRLARTGEAAVVGDECVIEPKAYLPAGVKVPPFKTIKATAVVNNNVMPVPAICAGTGYDAARPADAGVLISGVTDHRGVAGDGACHLSRGQPLR